MMRPEYSDILFSKVSRALRPWEWDGSGSGVARALSIQELTEAVLMFESEFFIDSYLSRFRYVCPEHEMDILLPGDHVSLVSRLTGASVDAVLIVDDGFPVFVVDGTNVHVAVVEAAQTCTFVLRSRAQMRI